MLTAVDSSVLLDVLAGAAEPAAAAERALRQAVREGGLIVCETVIAEITPALGKQSTLEFLDDLGARFVASSVESALLAGEIFSRHLKRTGKPRRVVPDFLIGAHATLHANRLLARDRGYLRDYFTGLKLWEP